MAGMLTTPQVSANSALQHVASAVVGDQKVTSSELKGLKHMARGGDDGKQPIPSLKEFDAAIGHVKSMLADSSPRFSIPDADGGRQFINETGQDAALDTLKELRGIAEENIPKQEVLLATDAAEAKEQAKGMGEKFLDMLWGADTTEAAKKHMGDKMGDAGGLR